MPDPTGYAAATEAGAKNKQFAPVARNLPRKIVIWADYDSVGHPEVVDSIPVQVLSPEDAGAKFGWGFQAHRLTRRVWDGSKGIECYVIPMPPSPPNGPGGVPATGTITFSATAAKAGIVYMRISGDPVFFSIANGDDPGDIRSSAIAAINADKNLPLTAAAGIGAGDVDVAGKDAAAHTDEITITFNWLAGEEFPEDVGAIVVAMSGGSGAGSIADSLNYLGNGDDANEMHLTDGVQGQGDAVTILDALSQYNGTGNLFEGCWAKPVARPFRMLNGDNAGGSGGLSAAKALGDSRKLDRTNGIVSVPGSPVPPAEIGAVAIGLLARLNQNRGAEHAVGQVLPGVLPGQKNQRWTNDYNNRNGALLAGVSPTIVDSGAVVLQNVASFYHPDDVTITSNGYRSMISISKLQNILWNTLNNFKREKWKGNSVVEDIAQVSNTVDREKAKDRKEVVGDLVELARQFAGHAWLYNASFTIKRLQDDKTLVEIRPGLTGFNSKIPVILSGEAGIFDNVVEFDTSIDILL